MQIYKADTLTFKLDGPAVILGDYIREGESLDDVLKRIRKELNTAQSGLAGSER